MPIRRMKGVIRIDTKRTHGWQVRVEWEGEKQSKFFSDHKYGGREKALHYALKYRDLLEADMGKPATERQIFSQSRSSTGVLGVHKDRKNNAFLAMWSPKKGVVKKEYVSKKEHGAYALEVAKKIRRQKMQEVLDNESKRRSPLPRKKL